MPAAGGSAADRLGQAVFAARAAGRCISKGKAHKRYEFGQKVAVATTNPQGRRDWFVAAHLCEGNPYDGHTLKKTLEQVQSITGVTLSDAYVDKG